MSDWKERECENCGQTCMVRIVDRKIIEKECYTCRSYHEPTPCEGEGCVVCKEIRSIKDKL